MHVRSRHEDDVERCAYVSRRPRQDEWQDRKSVVETVNRTNNQQTSDTRTQQRRVLIFSRSFTCARCTETSGKQYDTARRRSQTTVSAQRAIIPTTAGYYEVSNVLRTDDVTGTTGFGQPLVDTPKITGYTSGSFPCCCAPRRTKRAVKFSFLVRLPPEYILITCKMNHLIIRKNIRLSERALRRFFFLLKLHVKNCFFFSKNPL